MRRREFITVLGSAVVAWPLAAHAQQPERMRRIGLLLGMAENDPEAQARVTAFRQGLQELGWVEGRNIQIDYRFAAGEATLIRAYVAELMALSPDLFVANSTAVIAALRQATSSIPIVFAVVPASGEPGGLDSSSSCRIAARCHAPPIFYVPAALPLRI